MVARNVEIVVRHTLKASALLAVFYASSVEKLIMKQKCADQRKRPMLL